MAEGVRTQAFERLRRLLFIVPYVSKHPGLPLEDVAKAAGMSSATLLEELEFLTMIGRPPFEPDNFIDIYVDEGRVYVDVDQRFSTPPRLTAAEGAALAAAAAILNPPVGSSLASALDKLSRVLPPQALEQFHALSSQLDAASTAPDTLATLTRGATERREVSFDYFSPERQATERRHVQPHELSSHRGAWYLAGFCLTRGEARLFRVDRMTKVTLEAKTFEASGGGSKRLPDARDMKLPVTVRFSAEQAPYLREQFGADVVEQADGSVDVTVPGDSRAWLVQWVLSFGGSAVVVAPAWARQAVFEAATKLSVSSAPSH